MILSGNIILITGGSSGIGLAMVKKFYELKNKVIIVARDIEKLKAVQYHYPDIHIFQCDLTKQIEIDGLIVFIEQNYPNLNVLIISAAIQFNYNFVDEQNMVSKVDYEISANLTSTIKLCGLLLPILLKNKNSAIVNISSGLAISQKKSAPVY